MKAINKIYIVIDTEAEKRDGYNKAIASKPYTSITQPRRIAAEKNNTDINDRRYVVEEIPLIPSYNRKCFGFKSCEINTPFGKMTKSTIIEK